MWYAGWDGGGTKTEVCITDESGRETACRFFGPLNPNGVNAEKVRETVRDAVRFMSEQPGGQAACGGTVIGAAGISSLQTRTLLESALAENGWKGKTTLAGDQEIALAGAIDGPGAILIAGTGSICYGRTAEGRLFRVGGFGYLIDDEGSGYAIGRDILISVVRAYDGRGNQTSLTEKVTRKLGAGKEDLQTMMTWLYSADTGKKDIAALAPLLRDALSEGDEAARGIAEKAASELANLVTTGWKRNGMEDGELALMGSILNHFPEIRQRMECRVHTAFPGIQIILPRRRPAAGAARMARNS